MNVLFFHSLPNEVPPHAHTMVTLDADGSDASTSCFNTGGMANVDIEDDGTMTVYTIDGRWYIVFEDWEVATLYNVLKTRADKKTDAVSPSIP